MAGNRSKMMIEFDGEDVSPTSLDPLTALQFAHSYLVLVQKIAAEEGKTLQFTGLTVEDKCAALATTVSSITTADRASAKARKFLKRPKTVPQPLEKVTRSVIDARKALPTKYTTTVITKIKRKVELTEFSTPDASERCREAISMRATVMAVGGKTKPKVTFDSIAEDRQFTLTATKEMAKQIARYLYDEVDIVAIIERDTYQRILDGELREFHVLQSDDPIGVWDKWYAENNQEWSQVDNVEEEIGRNGYGPEEAPASSTH